MADDESDLLNSALNDAPEPEAGQHRDEKGRFAAKEEEPKPETVEVQPEQPKLEDQPKPEARDGIPSWRLKEEADARRSEAERANRLERELAEMRGMVQRQQKQAEPAKAPDFWEDQPGFVRHEASALVDPVKSEIATLREFYSRKEAIREHGVEKVTAAYNALDQGIRSRDPEAIMIYQRSMDSMDPFGDIMNWHQKQTLFSQVGSDPNAWFEKQLEERLKDQAFSGKMLERIRGNVQQQRPPVTQLPPSLSKATAAAPPGDDEDEGEAGLLKSALRR